MRKTQKYGERTRTSRISRCSCEPVIAISGSRARAVAAPPLNAVGTTDTLALLSLRACDDDLASAFASPVLLSGAEDAEDDEEALDAALHEATTSAPAVRERSSGA